MILSHPEKCLEVHLKNVGEMIYSNLQCLPLAIPFPKELFCEIGKIIGLYHDFGKATSFFQKYLNEQNPDRKAKLKNQKETNHSLLSAVAAYFATELVLNEYKCDNLDSYFLEFLPIASFLAVRRHHTGLEKACDDLRLENKEVLKKQIKHLQTESLSFLPYLNDVFEKLQQIPTSWPLRKIKLLKLLEKNHTILPHLIFYLLYSLLLDSDKHDAALGMFPKRIQVPSTLIEKYRLSKGFDTPRNDIGRLRNKISAEVLAQLENNELLNKHILSFTAPTGSGKTLVVLDFALRLRSCLKEKMGFTPRIIYALPFLSIIDQNAQVLGDVICNFGLETTTDIMLVHHHLSDYSYKTIENEYNPDEGEILIEGWDSEIIITTFIQLFHTLFSNRNRAIRKFNKIAGSIVILDEIQSFPHKYWLLFKETAEQMAKYFNTYFVMVTATQPAIFDKTTELLPNNKDFFSAFNRYQVKTNTAPQNLTDFSQMILRKLRENKKSTLIVLNTINAAKTLYCEIKNEFQSLGFETYFLSSHVIPKIRLQRIKKIMNNREKNKLQLVISTQLVEAGVDIDFDFVVRDLGPFDSVNQVAGRANRNQKSGKAEVEIVCLKDDRDKKFYSYIYDPVMIDITKKIFQGKTEIPESIFLELNRQYFQELKSRMSDDNSKEFLEYLSTLNYEEVGRFQLIDEYDKVDLFVEINDEASQIWQEFVKLHAIVDIRKRKEMFQSLKGVFYQYVISVSKRKAAENLPPEVSGFRFVSYDQIVEYYDFETGFIEKGGYSSW